MQHVRLTLFDRCALGALHAQLLSSQTTGSFQLDGASALGTQLASVPAGQSVVVTIESEQVLCSALTVVGTTVTCVIATGGRGYGGTGAATHALGTAAELHVTKAHLDRVNEHLARFDDDGLILPITTLPTIVSTTEMSVAGIDVTAHFTPGRVFIYEVSGTWYRAVVVSSAFSTDTTITVNGSGLPASGTIQYAGFGMSVSAKSPTDLELRKDVADDPATNPPSGHSWIYFKAGLPYAKNSAGIVTSIVPTMTGVISMFGAAVAPAGWLLCDGSAVSRTTYAALFAVLFPTIGTFTVTIAAPGEVALTGHGLATGDGVYLTTTGALPTGLSANVKYWVVKKDANSFWLATSLANALAGTKITTTGTQSGTHTSVRCPFDVGNGSTTFTLPNMKGAVAVGNDQAQAEFAGLGQTGGEKAHALTEAEMASHSHNILMANGSAGVSRPQISANGATTADYSTATAGSGTAHNNLQPHVVLNYIIKT